MFERYNIVSECDLIEAARKLNAMQPVPPTEVRLKPDTTDFRFPRKNWRRRPDLNRRWRFCRFRRVLQVVESSCSLVSGSVDDTLQTETAYRGS